MGQNPELLCCIFRQVPTFTLYADDENERAHPLLAFAHISLMVDLFLLFFLSDATAEEVVDVTRRYTVDYDTVVTKRRRSIREAVLAKVKTHPVFFLA